MKLIRSVLVFTIVKIDMTLKRQWDWVAEMMMLKKGVDLVVETTLNYTGEMTLKKELDSAVETTLNYRGEMTLKKQLGLLVKTTLTSDVESTDGLQRWSNLQNLWLLQHDFNVILWRGLNERGFYVFGLLDCVVCLFNWSSTGKWKLGIDPQCLT